MALFTAFPHRSTGATLVEWGYFALGYCDDRVQIQENPFYEDIFSDSNGGANGPPEDVYYLGATAIITCTINRITLASIEAIAQYGRTNTGNYGLMEEAGTSLRHAPKYYELTLSNQTEELKYPVAFLRQGRRFNVGVRHQIYSVVFECHASNEGSNCYKRLFTKSAGVQPCP